MQAGHTWASDETPEVKSEAHEKQKAAALDFGDYDSAYRGYSTREILRSFAILRLCRSERLVRNAEALVETSKALLGDGITYSALERSFFRQFCPGTNPLALLYPLMQNSVQELDRRRHLSECSF